MPRRAVSAGGRGSGRRICRASSAGSRRSSTSCDTDRWWGSSTVGERRWRVRASSASSRSASVAPATTCGVGRRRLARRPTARTSAAASSTAAPTGAERVERPRPHDGLAEHRVGGVRRRARSAQTADLPAAAGADRAYLLEQRRRSAQRLGGVPPVARAGQHLARPRDRDVGEPALLELAALPCRPRGTRRSPARASTWSVASCHRSSGSSPRSPRSGNGSVASCLVQSATGCPSTGTPSRSARRRRRRPTRAPWPRARSSAARARRRRRRSRRGRARGRARVPRRCRGRRGTRAGPGRRPLPRSPRRPR